MKNPFALTLDVQRQAWEGAARMAEKGRVAPERAETINEVDVGETPSEVVYEENKLRLEHYEARTEEQHDVPILIVYALINRPYILDLQPDRSVVRRLLEAGFDVYLIDWGEPSPLDRSLTLDDYVTRYVDNCVDEVRERSGQDAINLLGYCMGGTMSAMYAALFPEKVRNLGLMAAGLCFAGDGGVLELWGAEDHYDPETVTDTFGNVPADFLDVGFALMDPVANNLTKYVRLYENVEDEDFVENFARMEQWLADGIDVAGATYDQFIRDVYQENKLHENELYLDGKRVDLEAIDMPVLQIVAEYDHLVPPSASKPFNEAVASEDTEILEFATGHIGMSVSSRSHAELWPDVCAWFEERSNGSVETEVESPEPEAADAALAEDVEGDETGPEDRSGDGVITESDEDDRPGETRSDEEIAERGEADVDAEPAEPGEMPVDEDVVEEVTDGNAVTGEEATVGDDLTDIAGIGEAYATDLSEAGIATVEALANADPDDLAEETGIAASRLEDWIERAAGR